jgi:hypothetical protein
MHQPGTSIRSEPAFCTWAAQPPTRTPRQPYPARRVALPLLPGSLHLDLWHDLRIRAPQVSAKYTFCRLPAGSRRAPLLGLEEGCLNWGAAAALPPECLPACLPACMRASVQGHGGSSHLAWRDSCRLLTRPAAHACISPHKPPPRFFSVCRVEKFLQAVDQMEAKRRRATRAALIGCEYAAHTHCARRSCGESLPVCLPACLRSPRPEASQQLLIHPA